MLGAEAAGQAAQLWGVSDASSQASSTRRNFRIRTAKHVADMPASNPPGSQPGRVGESGSPVASTGPPKPKAKKLIAVQIRPDPEGGNSAAQLAQALMRQAHDPNSRLRAIPGLKSVSNAFLAPKGKSFTDIVADSFSYPQAAAPKQDGEGLGGVGGLGGLGGLGGMGGGERSAAKPRMRTAREVADVEAPKSSDDLWKEQILASAQGPGPLAASEPQIGGVDEFMTEAQRKAWSQGTEGLVGPQASDGKSMRMKIRTARDIVDDSEAGSEAGGASSKAPWEASDPRPQETDTGFMTEAQRKAWSQGTEGLVGPQASDGKSMRMKIRTAGDVVDDSEAGSEAGGASSKAPWEASDPRPQETDTG